MEPYHRIKSLVTSQYHRSLTKIRYLEQLSTDQISNVHGTIRYMYEEVKCESLSFFTGAKRKEVRTYRKK